MARSELVFVTTPEKDLEDLHALIEEELILDWGTTDEQGLGYLVLRMRPETLRILESMRETETLLDYTVFSLDVLEVQRGK